MRCACSNMVVTFMIIVVFRGGAVSILKGRVRLTVEGEEYIVHCSEAFFTEYPCYYCGYEGSTEWVCFADAIEHDGKLVKLKKLKSPLGELIQEKLWRATLRRPCCDTTWTTCRNQFFADQRAAMRQEGVVRLED